MRIHKALKIPELEYPAPFALAPSHECEKLCVFTSGGSSQLRVGAWLIIGIALFGLFVATIGILDNGLSSTVNHHRFGHVPVWTLFPIGIALLLAGILLLKNAMQRSQIIIEKKSNRAQIQYPKFNSSNTKYAKITITESTLHTGPLTGFTTKSQRIRQGKWYIVAIDVSFDCFIMAGFRSIDYATQYAERIAEQTNLALSDEHNEVLRNTADERKYLLQSKDSYADSNLIKSKPISPISFG